MLTIKFDKHGKAISDFNTLDIVKNTIYKLKNSEDDIELHIANETVVDLILAAISAGVISSSKVKLYCDDLEIRIKENGELLDHIPLRISEVVCDAIFKRNKSMFED